MRRRGNVDGVNDDNGIVFLPSSPSKNGENKYGRRQGRYCSSFVILLCGGLFIIAIYLVNSIGGVKNDRGSINAASDAGQNIPDSDTNNANITASSGHKSPPTIPRRLIFTYKYNLIDPSHNDPPFNDKDPLTANVLNTIDKYTDFWYSQDVAALSGVVNRSNFPKEEVVVSFLSDGGCVEVITKAEPRLVKHFSSEKRGEFKADICRVAELYVYGGYYFDIDIKVVEPIKFDELYLPSKKASVTDWNFRAMGNKALLNAWKLPRRDDIVTFATVFNGQGEISSI